MKYYTLSQGLCPHHFMLNISIIINTFLPRLYIHPVECKKKMSIFFVLKRPHIASNLNTHLQLTIIRRRKRHKKKIPVNKFWKIVREVSWIFEWIKVVLFPFKKSPLKTQTCERVNFRIVCRNLYFKFFYWQVCVFI